MDLRMSRSLVNIFLVFVMSLCGAWPTLAQDTNVRTIEELSLPLYKSGILNLEKNPSQISVANPGIADILILRGTQVHVLAKALGSTNVVFWDQSSRIFASIDIEVTHDLDSLKKKLHILLPGENIGVHSAQEKLVLNGNVSSAANLSAALEIAESYLPECIDARSSSKDGGIQIAAADGKTTNQEGCKKASIVNMMTVGGSQQVMLEVKVAEISRSFMRSLDTNLNYFDISGNSNFGAVNGSANFPNLLTPDDLNVPVPLTPSSPSGAGLAGPVIDKFEPVDPTITGSGIFFSTLDGNNYLQAAIEISRAKGLSKILAEPNLTTLTGKPAKFLSGGEFPIATTTRDGVRVVYKEFGVLVDFLPTILDGERISLDLDIGVSELRLGQLIGGFPIIDKRGASTTVELKNGQTIGIAGLIQDNLTENFEKLPGLGDLPLLVFVTPHLAKPISPDLIKLPTDSFVPPNDLEFYLLGKMSSLKKPEKKSYRKSLDGGFDGVTFGHKL